MAAPCLDMADFIEASSSDEEDSDEDATRTRTKTLRGLIRGYARSESKLGAETYGGAIPKEAAGRRRRRRRLTSQPNSRQRAKLQNTITCSTMYRNELP